MSSIKNVFVNTKPSDKERKNFAILDVIRKYGPVAKSEISRLTGLNVVTISNYMEGYVKNGLVAEEGYDASSGGRKPMLVDLNYKSAYTIGLGFDMYDIIGVICDLKYNVVYKVKKERRSESTKGLIENLASIVEDILRQSLVEKSKIKGIGLAVAGIIDRGNRTIRWPGPLGTQDVIISISLWDEFAKQFALPTVISNDADCAAFAEQSISLGPEYKDVLYMYSGVGCGIMINGQVYSGASGCAGELGILNPDAFGDYDWGQASRGLGRWSMDLGIIDEAKALREKRGESKIFASKQGTKGDIKFFSILEAARAKDKLALELLAAAGERLGKKVAFLVNLLNPQIVIIGGGVERAGPVLMDSLKKTVKGWALEEVTRVLKIMPAQLAENAVPVGAAALVSKHYFEQL